jgi:hypothetical protein
MKSSLITEKKVAQISCNIQVNVTDFTTLGLSLSWIMVKSCLHAHTSINVAVLQACQENEI